MLEILGLGSQVLLALDFEQTYWRTFLSNATLFDGVKEVLDDTRRLGIPVAVVTDLTAQIQFRKIVYWELDHFFDYIVTSEEAGSDKPSDAPFKLAIEKMQPTGSKIWMVGDHPRNDIWGSKKTINAITIQKLHKGVEEGTRDTIPDAVFSEFSELRKLLKKLNPNWATLLDPN